MMISDRATRSTRARPAPRTHWRGIVRALFLIAALLAIPVAAQTIEGQLLDGATRQPVPVGVVSLLAEEGRVVERVEADSAGRFRIDAPDAGSYFLRAERIGYRTVTDGIFDLGRDGRLEVEIWMRASPVELEGVEANVEARTMYEERLDRMLRNQGFYDRQTRTSGWFITPEDIEERPPTRPRDLFRMIPGMITGDVTGMPGSDGIVGMKCAGQPSARQRSIHMGTGGFAVYIDGIRVFLGKTWDMGMDLQMSDIAAVEVYPRISSMPIEYAGLGVCGVILIWTG